MAITYYGEAHNPADNAARLDNAGASVLTPPASMTADQLVFAVVCWANVNTSRNIVVSQAGGQTWNSLTLQHAGANGNFRAFWCQFNGTWSASPSFAESGGVAAEAFTARMLVFTPNAGYTGWSIDVVDTPSTFPAPASPFNVTITGQTPVSQNVVTIATWMANDAAPTWTLQTVGWSQPEAQLRNSGGSQLSLSNAYLIQSGSAATGNVTNRQSGGNIGYRDILTFTDGSPLSTRVPRMGLLGVG